MTIGNGILLSGVSILVALTVAPASAQVASTVSDVATPPNAASDDGSIGDIVVTAQRREQRLQDVPITISPITSAQAAAAGVTGTSSLQFAVPGLIINRQANHTAPYIRGIGTSNSNPRSQKRPKASRVGKRAGRP